MNDQRSTTYRPPIVTIMGHVDHGKTTLLDAIRKTNVAGGEHGGITQHIGAYQITHNSQLVTFVDTPGHAAFEKMRSRGAEVADIVILVVAANDSVKPQTIEAIKHIKRAKKPMIVAITKVDLENINIQKVKGDLKTNDVLIEEYSGQVPIVEISVPNKKGIDNLLELIHLVWQMNPQPYLEKEPLEAVVVESYLDKQRGPIVAVIVKKGTIRVGQKIDVDNETIAVKALLNDTGARIQEAKPSQPVEILGFKKILEVGSIVRDSVMTGKLTQIQKTFDHASIIAKALEVKDKFKVIVKADVLGSLEAIKSNLPEKVLIIYSGIGDVEATDVNFAKGAKAPVLAFNVKTLPQVQQLAQREQILIRNYKVIYELIDDMEEIAESFKQAKHEQKIQGAGKVVATFNIEGKKIAGVKITSGKIKMGDKIILRSKETGSYQTEVVSLKKFKKEVASATAGQECGILFAGDLDFKEGDVIESLG